MGKYYAVRNGRQTGVFSTWNECQDQVKGFKGAEYKSFKSLPEAENYVWGQQSNRSGETSNAGKESLNVFVDGSFVKDNYSWAFVVYNNLEEIVHSDAGVGTNKNAATMRNVAGELAAVMRAAKWAKENGKTIVIHHDYQGISSWVDGSWRAKNDMTQQYQAFMKQYQPFVTFQKVKGHTGVEGNEMADQLAREALGI